MGWGLSWLTVLGRVDLSLLPWDNWAGEPKPFTGVFRHSKIARFTSTFECFAFLRMFFRILTWLSANPLLWGYSRDDLIWVKPYLVAKALNSFESYCRPPSEISCSGIPCRANCSCKKVITDALVVSCDSLVYSTNLEKIVPNKNVRLTVKRE